MERKLPDAQHYYYFLNLKQPIGSESVLHVKSTEGMRGYIQTPCRVHLFRDWLGNM